MTMVTCHFDHHCRSCLVAASLCHFLSFLVVMTRRVAPCCYVSFSWLLCSLPSALAMLTLMPLLHFLLPPSSPPMPSSQVLLLSPLLLPNTTTTFNSHPLRLPKCLPHHRLSPNSQCRNCVAIFDYDC